MCSFVKNNMETTTRNTTENVPSASKAGEEEDGTSPVPQDIQKLLCTRYGRELYGEDLANGSRGGIGIALPEKLNEELHPLNEEEETSKRSDLKLLQSKLVLDGVVLMTRSLAAFRPTRTTRFGQLTQQDVKVFYGEKMKGFKFLYSTRVYKIQLCSFGGYKLSLFYLVNHFIPTTYVDHGKLATCVNRLTRLAIKKVCDEDSNFKSFDWPLMGNGVLSNDLEVSAHSFRRFAIIFKEVLVCHFETYSKKVDKLFWDNRVNIDRLNAEFQRYPERMSFAKGWTEFGEQPFRTREREDETYDESIWFCLERYGTELTIPPNVHEYLSGQSGDAINLQKERNLEFLLENAKQFTKTFIFRLYLDPICKDYNTHVVFHYAIDFWIENMLQQTSSSTNANDAKNPKILFWNFKNVEKKCGRCYERFHIFALPGVANLVTKLPKPDSLIFYARVGHEIHRNLNKWFGTTNLTEIILSLVGQNLFPPSKRKIYMTKKLELVKTQAPVTLITNFLESIKSCETSTAARFELHHMVSFEEPLENHIEHAFVLGLHYFKNFIKTNNINDPGLFVAINPTSLLEWLRRTMVPAQQIVKKAIEFLLQGSSEIFDMAHDLQYAEFLLSFLIYGRKTDHFSVVHASDLGFNILRFLNLGDAFVLKNVILVDNQLRFILPSNFMDFKLIHYLLGKSQGETSDPLFKKFSAGMNWKKISRHTKEGQKERARLLLDYVSGIFFMLKNATLSKLMKEVPTEATVYPSTFEGMRTKILEDLTRYDKWCADEKTKSSNQKVPIFFEFMPLDVFWKAMKGGLIALPGGIEKVIKCTIDAILFDERNQKLFANQDSTDKGKNDGCNVVSQLEMELPPTGFEKSLLSKIVTSMTVEKTALWTFVEHKNSPENVTVCCVVPHRLEGLYAKQNLELCSEMMHPKGRKNLLSLVLRSVATSIGQPSDVGSYEKLLELINTLEVDSGMCWETGMYILRVLDYEKNPKRKANKRRGYAEILRNAPNSVKKHILNVLPQQFNEFLMTVGMQRNNLV